MAKKRDLSKPLSAITFRCPDCRHTFKALPSEVIDAPEFMHHPFRYLAACEICNDSVEQAPFERALFKAWSNATGPKTPEGKAATAANLEGHPTPEEAMRTRFNAMKHGLTAKTATYFPARPDGYSFCVGCKVDRDFCAAQSACQTQTMLFMQVHAAFEQRDPKKLTGIFSGMQAATIAVVQQMLQTILADGVTLRNPEWYTNKDGGMNLACYTDPMTGERQQIMNIEAHPLLKTLSEFLTRNNMNLGDLGMTPKVIEQQDESMGRLKNDDERGSVTDFMQKQTEQLALLVDKMGNAKARAKNDPVLIEYQRENGGEG